MNINVAYFSLQLDYENKFKSVKILLLQEKTFIFV